MSDYDTLLVEKRGQVDWLTLNRPNALNAINTPMVTELRDYFGLFNRAYLSRGIILEKFSIKMLLHIKGMLFYSLFLYY